MGKCFELDGTSGIAKQLPQVFPDSDDLLKRALPGEDETLNSEGLVQRDQCTRIGERHLGRNVNRKITFARPLDYGEI